MCHVDYIADFSAHKNRLKNRYAHIYISMVMAYIHIVCYCSAERQYYIVFFFFYRYIHYSMWRWCVDLTRKSPSLSLSKTQNKKICVINIEDWIAQVRTGPKHHHSFPIYIYECSIGYLQLPPYRQAFISIFRRLPFQLQGVRQYT